MATFNCGVCETSLVTGTRSCTYQQVIWRFFNVNCPKGNLQCSTTSGAWVPAITVCNQRLFT